ncbi:DUF948 domain-containing protein [Thermoactinospora rubra]|uniref:DUF948 domain-containing protein n=1 Tax=Thermoactinospora rubra TaxID=1088767 RepID=UPI000A0F6EC8|nr:DUF948 domain-containing protein [Thermoactinospora rubra]
MLTAGEVAGLVAVIFWAILVGFLAMVLLKLARLLTETTKMVSDLGKRVVPLLEDVSLTVNETNRQLVAVEAIAKDIKQVSGHAAKVSALTQTLFTGPLVKLSALLHGIAAALRARKTPRALPGRRR